MTGFVLRTRMVFDWDGAAYRIERLAPNDQIVLERLSDGQIDISCRNDLLMAYRAGKITTKIETDKRIIPTNYSRPLQKLAPKILNEVKRRMVYIQAIEEAGAVVFTPEYLAPLIRDVATSIDDPKPPSVTTFYRWYRRLQQHAEARALVPRYDRRGCTELRQSNEVLSLFMDALQESFQASPAATGSSIYDRFAGKLSAENERRLPGNQLPIPSLRTVYRLFDRVEAYDLVSLKEGKSVADRRFRIAKAGPKVNAVLERVEVDHTPLDLFLIDEITGLPLGRPVLTLYIDVYSRFPLGYYLSYGGTSASAVLGALRHAILPKKPVPEVIADLHVDHQWPCYGVMDLLVLDNGLEFHGFDLESVAFDLGIRLQYCPKHQPRFKGVIERFLKTVNYFFTHQIPGTSLARFSERGDYDPQKHALITLAEFKQLFEKWLLDVYAQTIHRGTGTTPRARWEEGVKRRAPVLPSSLYDLQRRIGLVKERALRNDGITINGLRYAGPELDSIIRAWGPGIKLRVVLDPEDLGAIQVWAPEQQEPVTVQVVNAAYAMGLTAVQHELIQQRLREDGKRTEDPKALIGGKYQLALAVDELLRSRKQRNRRRGANIHGITSAKPEARLLPGLAPMPVAKPPIPAAEALGDVPPAPLSTFQLRNGKG